MGFDEEPSLNATKKFKGNLNKSINYLIKTTKNQDNSANHNNQYLIDEVHWNQNPLTALESTNGNLVDDNKADNKVIQQHISKNHFDDIVHKINLNELSVKCKTTTEIANKLLHIYKELLLMTSNASNNNYDSDKTMPVESLHDMYHDIQLNLINEENNGTIYKIYECFIQCTNGETCDPNKCKYIVHKFRNRTQVSYLKNDYTGNKHKYHIIYDLLTDVHCFMLHYFDLYALTPKEINQVNKDESGTIDVDQVKKRIAKLSKINIYAQHASRTFTKNSIGHKINAENALKNKTNHSTDENPIENESKYDNNAYDDSHIYDFGYKFTYWNKNDDCYVSKKYSNLKQELVGNKEFPLTIDEWNVLNENCEFLLKTETGKKYFPKANGNELYNINIEQNTLIQLQYLQSVKLYTDYTELCSALCSTFRPQNTKETYAATKSRNAELANWSKLLAETVQYYGKCMSEEKESIQTVYRGINNNFIFNKFVARCNAPISTSTDIVVALKFASNGGMILELERHEDFQCFYFDCQHISAFNEFECLFFGGDPILKIATIKCIYNEEWINYYNYLEAVHFLLTLIRNGDCDQISISDTSKKELVGMLQNHLLNHINTNIPEYIQNLLQYHLTNAPKTLTLNYQELKEKHKFLKNVFIKTYGMLDIVNIWKCFPSTMHLQITLPSNYVFTEVFIHSLVEDLNAVNELILHKSKSTLQLTFDFNSNTHMNDDVTEANKNILTGIYNEFEKINWEIQYLQKCITFLSVEYIAPQSKLTPIKTETVKKKEIRKIDKKSRMIVSGYIRMNSHLLLSKRKKQLFMKQKTKEPKITFIPADIQRIILLYYVYPSPGIAEYKITMLGARGTAWAGKSALVIRLVTDNFLEEWDPTIEDSYRKDVIVDNVPCLLDILDTAGTEEFKSLMDQWIREGDAFLLLYPITCKDSFGEMEMLREIILRSKDDDEYTPMVLVGSKCDLEEHRKVSRYEGEELANEWGDYVTFIETSAKDKINVEEAFYEAVRLIRKKQKLESQHSNNLNEPAKKDPFKKFKEFFTLK